MHNNKKIKPFLATLAILISVNCDAALSKNTSSAPFEARDLKEIEAHLFANITTTTNTVTKTDGQVTIHSIPGAVLASPSNKGSGFSQDYQFHWVRDAAIIMNEVTYLYTHGTAADKKRLRPYLSNYVDFELKAQQQISNDGEQTLGQPKYNIDGTVWEGKWMRPQNDGAALRAITMINIAHEFWREGDEKYVGDKLLGVIDMDLNYIVSEWQTSSYDLWEEVNDPHHFFTKMVQRKALLEGYTLYKDLGMNTQAIIYQNTARLITDSLEKHWDTNRGYFAETIDQQFIKGGGLNSAILLGALYGNLQNSHDPFALDNDRIMSSVYFIRNGFARLYKVNITQAHHSPLIGRYPNDIYDGNKFTNGNPWILTTNAFAEYYYSLAKIYNEKKKITVTKNNIHFFQQIDPHLVSKEGVISLAAQPTQFNAITHALMAEGDKFLNRVKRYGTCYTDKTCHHFAEQIDRANGKQTSAKDLTWGYATLLSAMQARSS